ncbi:diaminobutyrate--2-oxoglutarate transaminase [Streptomyces anulatus]
MSEQTDFPWFEQHESQVRTYCRRFPVLFSHGRGSHLWDSSGRRYLDLLCGSGSLNYGHNHPLIAERVTRYLRADGLVHSLDLYSTAKEDFLRSFVRTVLEPRGLNTHRLQFPGPGGTLAVEAALKLARKVTRRTGIIAFDGGFHGASLGSLAVTTSPSLRAAAGVDLPHATFLPFGGDAERLRRTAAEVRPAAIILETVQGEGGLRVAGREWLSTVRSVADSVGALLIVDDIQAGSGRTGTFFSFDGYPELRPEIVCLSKSLSGLGLPMAAVLIDPAYDQWEPGEHNGTFRGNNLGFVGATAALELWADPVFRDQVSALTAAMGPELAAAAREAPFEVSVVGRGAMRGLRFPDAALTTRVQAELFADSVIAETAGEGCVLKLFPPLTMPVAEWSDTCAILAAAMKRAGRDA